MRRPIKFLTVLLLVLSLGLHWALLQTVAWTGMLVTYSQDGAFSEAVSKTFDGKHPCCMCKAIESARQDEQKQSQEKFNQDAKIKCVLPAETAILYAPMCSQLPTPLPAVFHFLLPEPETPPPRSCRAV